MASNGNLSWTDAEIAQVLAAHFGDKVSESQLRSLAADVSAAIADRRRRELGLEAAPPVSATPTMPPFGSVPSVGRGELKGVLHHDDQ